MLKADLSDGSGFERSDVSDKEEQMGSHIFGLRSSFPDSGPSRARASLRAAVRELEDRSLLSAASWAQELLAHVPRSEDLHFDEPQDAGDAPSTTARAGTTRRGAPSSTPARYTRSAFPVHSTPALGGNNLVSSSTHLLSPGQASNVAASPAKGADESGRFASFRLPPSPLARPYSPSDQGSAHVHFASSQDTSRLSSVDADSLQRWSSADVMDDYDADNYAFARSLFGSHQLERCAWVLESRKVPGDKAKFLRLYASFLLAERHLDTEAAIIPVASNKGISAETADSLLNILRELIDPSDAFLLYLKGILLQKFGKRIEALDCFVRSVAEFPYCWSSWLEISSALNPESGELGEIADLLPDSFMTAFFVSHHSRHIARIHRSTNDPQRCEALLRLFPGSPYVMSCKAHSHYVLEEYAAAEVLWKQARQIDPHCNEGLGGYSNLLFVLNKYEELAHLTNSLIESGRDSAEICCALANYHTSRGNHHRSVQALQRALRLDPSCVNAWVLLGHAYIELRNAQAATEMYRRAIDIAPHDHRAWYGLGYAYELNEAPHYCLHHFQKACALNPFLPSLWIAQANCYEKLGRSQHAISCYKRALSVGSASMATIDQISHIECIITLYEAAGDILAAATWHKRIVDLVEGARESADPLPFERYVASYVVAARWEMGDIASENQKRKEREALLNPNALRHIKNSQIARAGAQRDKDTSAMDLDSQEFAHQIPDAAIPQREANPALANEYLTRVIAANTEHTAEAEDLLKRLAFLPGPPV
ncbi:TPR-like protein [Ceraceosorus guamensis]|uniref:TPR-like protein n=1 Tax=Ceraceosorus guamensis TaxID=1522189 RepID=A0A316VYK7_9BASI|nr:TPR-like protein [Ceraceosorus guamensis]PWN42580.1 TPR-like protein [Ceraceosorus guamensis]